VLAAVGNARSVIATACADIVAAEAARADAASRLRTGVEAADQAVGFILGGNLAGKLAHRTDLAAAIGCTPRQLDRAFSDPSNCGHCDRVLAAVDALVDAMAVATVDES
jgi:bacterioferritin-associated ferredoxin